jgi:hypothetical protein
MQLIAAGSVASLSGCVDVPRGGGGDGSSSKLPRPEGRGIQRGLPF